MKKESHQFMIIGIDGGTFKVMDYLVSQGRLPNLNKLMAGGVKAEMASPIPPLKHSSGVSLYTGKNSEKHSVCDAVRRQKDGPAESSITLQKVH